MIGELAQDAYERGVAVELEGKGPVPVRGAPGLLGILLRNLVDNAARYGPRGGTVRVRVDARPPGAVLSVTDEGPGIAPAERARVLDRFFRALGTSEPGVGLGLSIATRIAALHGASLELGEGPGGRGLAVRVDFPNDPARGPDA